MSLNRYRVFRIICMTIVAIALIASLMYRHSYTGIITYRGQRQSWLDNGKVSVIKLKTPSGVITLKDVKYELFGKKKQLGLPQPSKTRYKIDTIGIPFIQIPNVMKIQALR